VVSVFKYGAEGESLFVTPFSRYTLLFTVFYALKWSHHLVTSGAKMDTKYLLQKGNRWYVRVAIPRPLWAQYTGKRHILKSLKTGDLKTAQRRRHTAVAAIKSGLEAEVSKYRKAARLVEQGVHTPGELIQATRMMVDDEGINIGHYTDWIWNLLEERFGLSENDGRPVLPPDWQPAISAGARAGQGYSRTPRQRCPGGQHPCLIPNKKPLSFKQVLQCPHNSGCSTLVIRSPLCSVSALLLFRHLARRTPMLFPGPVQNPRERQHKKSAWI
jgi:hypothetical protein